MESRLIRQNAPNPEQISNPNRAEGSGAFEYLTPDQVQAIGSAREARLAPLREKEASSKQADQQRLPQIEKQMQMA